MPLVIIVCAFSLQNACETDAVTSCRDVFLQRDGEVVGIFEGAGLAGGVGRVCKAQLMIFLVQTDL